ncbi:hypothetical protein FIBSPDRAFT_970836 [Athelia psychrophila]|uniref:Uncharacterized protein n=1 Tax=Athelia psychrophila TaxID=1759441 RepID=A0A167SHF7_9AGAM|nr:hypothetical protein FIBSPDRAFT_970836 [Fibularhizoctonia sp. CBS 109695]
MPVTRLILGDAGHVHSPSLVGLTASLPTPSPRIFGSRTVPGGMKAQHGPCYISDILTRRGGYACAFAEGVRLGSRSRTKRVIMVFVRTGSQVGSAGVSEWVGGEDAGAADEHWYRNLDEEMSAEVIIKEILSRKAPARCSVLFCSVLFCSRAHTAEDAFTTHRWRWADSVSAETAISRQAVENRGDLITDEEE